MQLKTPTQQLVTLATQYINIKQQTEQLAQKQASVLQDFTTLLVSLEPQGRVPRVPSQENLELVLTYFSLLAEPESTQAVEPQALDQDNETDKTKYVRQRPDTGKWEARVPVEGRRRSLGSFATKTDAIDAVAAVVGCLTSSVPEEVPTKTGAPYLDEDTAQWTYNGVSYPDYGSAYDAWESEPKPIVNYGKP